MSISTDQMTLVYLCERCARITTPDPGFCASSEPCHFCGTQEDQMAPHFKELFREQRSAAASCAETAEVSIATVVPVLGRPDAIAPLIESWSAASREDGRLVFVASPEDTPTVRMLRLLEPEHIVCGFEAGHADFARKINLAYELTDDDWIFQAADDVRFEDGWDTALLATAAETGAQVIGSNDCMNPAVKAGRHSTHILFARSYCDDPGASLDGPGTVFSTVYGHQYVDNEAIGLAQRRGVWAFSAASRVVHQHPFWLPGGRRNLDATYRKGLSSSGQDARLWRQRQRLLLRLVP